MIDTHCHIVCDELYPEVDRIIKDSIAIGITKLLVICINLTEAERGLNLYNKYPNLIELAIGFHPSDLSSFNDKDYEELERYLKLDCFVALGEIGLDYHYEDTNKDEQAKGFIRQIEIANKIGKPIIVHMREATEDTLSILKKYLKVKGIMHCYSGSYETAIEVIRLGMLISVGGPITFKNARGLPEVIQRIDPHKLLIETDCPYLTPHPLRGDRNEPKYIAYTFNKIVDITNVEKDVLEDIMLNNYIELFK
ncbi:MAG: TatD family hydrolase [Erysipelotrichaceae bacterium]